MMSLPTSKTWACLLHKLSIHIQLTLNKNQRYHSPSLYHAHGLAHLVPPGGNNLLPFLVEDVTILR